MDKLAVLKLSSDKNPDSISIEDTARNLIVIDNYYGFNKNIEKIKFVFVSEIPTIKTYKNLRRLLMLPSTLDIEPSTSLNFLSKKIFCGMLRE